MKEKMALDDQYWSARYINNQASWDIGYPSTPLKEYIDQLEDRNIRILIPGCGNAYEADYLVEKGFSDITLLDLSESLVLKLKEKFSGKKLSILHEDLFDHSGQYDLILEQTFFCALDPGQRNDYAVKMYELLKKGGLLAGVLFNRQFDENPPYGGDQEEYRNLFEQYFRIKKLESCYNSIGPRAGTELFIHLEK